jgi:sulfatase modifying factor 1
MKSAGSTPRRNRICPTGSLSLLCSLPLPALAVVNIDWVTVGDPGNVCDTQSWGCFGAVSNEYRIGKYEVTNAQYAEFLNAVAATDPNALYDIPMGMGSIGITRIGSSGSYSYSTISGRENMPVDDVSFWHATRFANWLHNGQPTGAQDGTTTEDGAYTLTPTGIANNTVTRNAAARVFIPSEDEWYKAAYYDPGAMVYFDYPAGSDTQTTCTTPGVTANTANCDFAVSDLTDVGDYTGSASPSGTFDQGGNVSEWTETIPWFSFRIDLGGNFSAGPRWNAAWERGGSEPHNAGDNLGFRVASPVPPPFPDGIPALSPLGLLAVAAGLLGVGAYCQGRA